MFPSLFLLQTNDVPPTYRGQVVIDDYDIDFTFVIEMGLIDKLTITATTPLKPNIPKPFISQVLLKGEIRKRLGL